MIKTKSPEVVFYELTPALAYMLYSLEKFHRKNGVEQPVDLVITAMSNGKHDPNSRHYKGEAIDLRSHNFPSRESKRIFRQELELCLGPQFRVLLEGAGTTNEHFHIQVRKGMIYNGNQ